jgi:hypothetical protein
LSILIIVILVVFLIFYSGMKDSYTNSYSEVTLPEPLELPESINPTIFSEIGGYCLLYNDLEGSFDEERLPK